MSQRAKNGNELLTDCELLSLLYSLLLTERSHRHRTVAGKRHLYVFYLSREGKADCETSAG